MPATATRRRPATPHITDLNPLVESYAAVGDNGAALRIDEEAAIIFGVKLGGRFSKNCHGIKGVTEGTEYKAKAYRDALSLYEGVKVYIKHAKGTREEKERGPFEYMGVIRHARYDDAADCPRGDFHYRKTHPDAPQLLEDVKRGMGGFGFSHHIPPGGYEGRVIAGRLVVEKINEIKSVDIVGDPATTRNLWESKPVEKTFKAILEEWVSDKSPARQAIAMTLLEDGDAPAAAMDAPVSADDSSGDPEDELWAGFLSAIMAIINSDSSAADKAKQIGKYLKAHEKLTSEKEPAADDSGDDSAKESKEAKESRETHELKAKVACLEAGIKSPTPALLKALALMDNDADRKALIEQTKTAADTTQQRKSGPRSGFASRSGAPRAPALTEGKVPTGDAFRRSIRD